MKQSWLLLLGSLLFAVASSTQAAVITGGTIDMRLDSLGDIPNPLTISGNGFAVSFALRANGQRIIDRGPYSYGSTHIVDFTLVGPIRYEGGSASGFLFNDVVYVGETLFGANQSFGGLTAEDRLFQGPAYPSTLSIKADPIVFPIGPFRTNVTTPFTLRGAFTASGSLCGYLRGSGTFGSQPCAFDLPSVTGQGHWEVQVSSGVGETNGGYWNIRSFTLTFEEPISEVPEPGTLLSTASMLAFVLAIRYQRLRKSL